MSRYNSQVAAASIAATTAGTMCGEQIVQFTVQFTCALSPRKSASLSTTTLWGRVRFQAGRVHMGVTTIGRLRVQRSPPTRRATWQCDVMAYSYCEVSKDCGCLAGNDYCLLWSSIAPNGTDPSQLCAPDPCFCS